MASNRIMESPSSNKLLKEYEKHRKSPSKTNLKFYIVGIAIAAAAVFIVFSAMQGATVYYYDLNEIQAKISSGTLPTEPYRVAGQVIAKSIVNGEGNTVTFEVSDLKLKDSTRLMKVTYSGAIPDTFKDDAQVTVTGKYDPSKQMFFATEMLAKCPSKYSTTAS